MERQSNARRCEVRSNPEACTPNLWIASYLAMTTLCKLNNALYLKAIFLNLMAVYRSLDVAKRNPGSFCANITRNPGLRFAASRLHVLMCSIHSRLRLFFLNYLLTCNVAKGIIPALSLGQIHGV